MFERFTPEARRALVVASESAKEFKHATIGNEHLLLGLLATTDADGRDPAPTVLAAAGVTSEFARECILALRGAGDFIHADLSSMGQDMRESLKLALREALSAGHGYIGSGHVLLGVLDVGQGISAQILQEAGAEPQLIYRQVMEQLGVRKPPRGPRRPGRRGGWKTI